MKAAPFEYARAADVDEACALLAADDGARVIAGGQTLVPMMAMRLARPTRLIDINRIAALSYIRAESDGIAIGATTRQCVAERDALIAAKLPLLGAGHSLHRPCRHARARHRGRLARPCRSGGGTAADRGHARCGLALPRRRRRRRARGARFLHRPDDRRLCRPAPVSPACAFRSGAAKSAPASTR